MQISRLFAIVYILLGRRHVTARELAERFEVSVRTIYRDIEALSQAGVPVYATQGAGGGIFISDAYVLNKSALTDAEQGEILMALRSLNATGHVESDQLLGRLASLFNKDSADWIEVDFSRWGNEERDRKGLAMIKEGILSRRLLTFTYYSGSGVRTQRKVSPLKLSYKSRAWYVHTFCHDREDYRTFKVVRMADVVLLEETFDKHALPEPKPPSQEPENPPPPVFPVVIRFRPEIAWRVMDEFDPEFISWNDDGTLCVKVHFQEDAWLYTYILSFGAAAEVLSPPFLRCSLLKTLDTIRKQYE